MLTLADSMADSMADSINSFVLYALTVLTVMSRVHMEKKFLKLSKTCF